MQERKQNVLHRYYKISAEIFVHSTTALDMSIKGGPIYSSCFRTTLRAEWM